MRTEERHPGHSDGDEVFRIGEVRAGGAHRYPAGPNGLAPVDTLDADTSDEDPVDGRSARRRRNASAVRRAAMALLAEGTPNPSARLVAERAGVSLRSVFRHFESIDQMIESAVLEFFTELVERCPAPAVGPADTLDVRIGRFVWSTIDRYAVSAPMMRAVAVLADRSPVIARCVEAERVRAVEDLERIFAPELVGRTAVDRRVSVALAQSATTFETWDNLVRGHGLGPDVVASVLRRMVRAALTS